MNNQEILNIVYPALMKQGTKSVTPPERNVMARCLYRGPCGTKCAVGHLIPDYVQISDAENSLPICDDSMNKLLRGVLGQDTDFVFLKECQYIHDNHDPEQWSADFERLASLNKLTLPQLIDTKA